MIPTFAEREMILFWKLSVLNCFCPRLGVGLANHTCCRTWWHHQMETFSALLAIWAGNSPVTGEFPTQRPVTRSFDVFVDLRLNKRLSKQSWGWWFETPWRPLWCQCNDRLPPLLMIYIWPCVSLVKQIILPPISRTHNRKVTNWNAPILSVFQFIPHPHTNPTHHPYKNWCYFIIPSYCLVFIKPTRIPHCAKIGKRAWETSQVRSCVQEFRW